MMKVLAGHIPGPASLPGLGRAAGRGSPQDTTAGHTTKLKGTIIYDTSKLNLEPKEPPAFRLPLVIEKAERKARKAAADEPAAIGIREQSRQQYMRQIEVLAGKGRPLITPTEGIEFEAGAKVGCGPTEERAPTDDGAPGPGDGAKFGTLVHTILEAADWDSPGDLEALAREKLGEAGAPDEMVPLAVKMVRKTLSSSLTKRILKSCTYQKEVPFAVNKDGGIIEGKMDAVFREGEDLYIVDFKTDRISAKDTKARAEHYRPQAEAYARALEASCGRLPVQVIFFFLHPMEIEALTPAA
jgi:hypothetical protein